MFGHAVFYSIQNVSNSFFAITNSFTQIIIFTTRKSGAQDGMNGTNIIGSMEKLDTLLKAVKMMQFKPADQALTVESDKNFKN